jgi:hypothetical protein
MNMGRIAADGFHGRGFAISQAMQRNYDRRGGDGHFATRSGLRLNLSVKLILRLVVA